MAEGSIQSDTYYGILCTEENNKLPITVLDSDRPSKNAPIRQASGLEVGSAHASGVGTSVDGMLSEQFVLIPDLLDSDKDYVRSFV